MPAVALNVIEVAPGRIVTTDGTLAAPEEELSVTVAPGASAGAVNATRQVDVPGGVTETGAQVKPFKLGCCWMVTAVPFATAGTEAPAPSAAPALENWTTEDAFVVVLDSVNDTLATTPFEMGVALKPHSTQFEMPGTLLLQETDLFTAIATGPGPTLTEEKSVGE
jgi:hypothetical protein